MRRSAYDAVAGWWHSPPCAQILREQSMGQRKSSARPKRLVWRISEAAPLGEFVDPDAAAPNQPKDQPEVSRGGWVVSSFELLHGTEISEGPDTVPDELFDELFPLVTAKPKSGGKDR